HTIFWSLDKHGAPGQRAVVAVEGGQVHVDRGTAASRSAAAEAEAPDAERLEAVRTALGKKKKPAQLSLESDRSARESAVRAVDAVIDRAASAGVVLADEIRRKARALAAK